MDDNWEVLHSSADGEDLFLPLVAFRRRSKSKRLDHIVKVSSLLHELSLQCVRSFHASQVKLVQPGETVPVGYELIKSSPSGLESALLKGMGYLAVRRADTSSVMFIEGEPLLDDLCVVLRAKGEELPEGYREVEKSTYHAAGAQSAANAAHQFSIGYHQRAPVGLCDLGYDSATLDRFPQQDYGGLSLPVNELPMFAFPDDLRLTYSSLNRFPLPVFFTFVFTDQNGGHLYAACLRFYEVVPAADLQPVFAQVYGTDQVRLLLPTDRVSTVVNKLLILFAEAGDSPRIRDILSESGVCRVQAAVLQVG